MPLEENLMNREEFISHVPYILLMEFSMDTQHLSKWQVLLVTCMKEIFLQKLTKSENSILSSFSTLKLFRKSVQEHCAIISKCFLKESIFFVFGSIAIKKAKISVLKSSETAWKTYLRTTWTMSFEPSSVLS